MPERPVVVVTHRIHPEIAALLSRHSELIANPSAESWDNPTLVAHARVADALMVFMPDCIDEDFLAACPNLKIVAAALKGYDNFDVVAMRRRGIHFTIVPDLLTQPTAELALALLLALARHVPAGDRQIRSGHFAGWRPTLYGKSLIGSTVGLVGYGAVGQALHRLLAGFDCHVLWHDQKPGSTPLDQVLSQSDFVLPLLPLSPSTLHFLNRDRIAQMKSGTYLVNVGRGSVVEEEAIADAIESGHLAGYAADVFEMEDWARPGRPAAISPRLLRLSDRTLFTPHLGSATKAARLEIERSAALSIIDVLENCPPQKAFS